MGGRDDVLGEATDWGQVHGHIHIGHDAEDKDNDHRHQNGKRLFNAEF